METKVCKTYSEAENYAIVGLDFMGNPMSPEMRVLYAKSPHALALLVMAYSTLTKKRIIDLANKEQGFLLPNNNLIDDVFNLIQDGIGQFEIDKLFSKITIHGKPILLYIAESGIEKIFNLLLPKLETDATPKQLKKLLKSMNKGYHGTDLSQDLLMASSCIDRGNTCYISMAKSILMMVLKKNLFDEMTGGVFTEHNIIKALKTLNTSLVNSKNLLISEEKYLEECLNGVHKNEKKYLAAVFKRQYHFFVTMVGREDLYWKLFSQVLSVQKVLLKLVNIPSDNGVSNDLRKYLALICIKEADLSLGATLILKEVLLYRMDETKGHEADLVYIRSKTKYFSKMNQKKTFGDTHTYKEILNNLNIRIERFKRWQKEWNKTFYEDDFQKALSLFITYSGSFITKSSAWGGDIGRFFKGHLGANHGHAVQTCLQFYFAKAKKESETDAKLLSLVLGSSLSSEDDRLKNHLQLIAFLTKLKLKIGKKVLNKEGDLSIILQIIYENTGIGLDTLVESEDSSLTSETYEENNTTSKDDSLVSLSI